jgi:hypothetical protein
MDWFRKKGVHAGHPELLIEHFEATQLKRVISTREKPLEDSSGLLERRLKRKLTICL